MRAPQSIYSLVELQAQKMGERPAIAGIGRVPLTFSGLLKQINYIGSAFKKMGLGSGDRIAVVLPNGPEMAVLFLGTSSFATCAPLNRGYRDNEFEFYLTDLKAKLVIVQRGVETVVTETASRLKIPLVEIEVDNNSPAGTFKFMGIPDAGGGVATPCSPEQTALILHTSGTTSRPKIVPLSHTNILASASNIKGHLSLTESDRCLNVMPLFHIHGLMAGLMSTFASGGTVVCAPEFDAKKFFTWFQEAKPTWLTAVPTILKSVQDESPQHLDKIKQNPLRFIRSSSSQLPIPLMEALKKTFCVPVIEAYGMTEASHQMTSNPLDGVQKPGSVGKAAGPEVAIMDENGKLLPAGEKGEIVIKGPNVTLGYENNPKANEASFTSGWFRTGDQGVMDSEGYLSLTGRLKEMINRGGEKISPLEVDQTIQKHPAVAQVATFAIPHKSLGEDVAAVVVLHRNAKVTVRELRQFAAQKLADFKVPQQILIMNEIPKGPTGKVQRNTLAEKLKGRLGGEIVAPQNELEKELARIWAGALKLNFEQVGVTSSFFALGGDSLQAMSILRKMGETLDISLTPQFFSQNPTIQELVQLKGKLPKANFAEEEPPLAGEISPMASVLQLLDFNCHSFAWRVLETKKPLQINLAEKCLTAIVDHHDALRSVFRKENGSWKQTVLAKVPPFVISKIDLSKLPRDQHQSELHKESDRLFKDLMSGFESGNAPAFRVALIDSGNHAAQWLVFMFHHAVADNYSVLRITEDFTSAYQRLVNGEPIHFAAKTTTIDKVAVLQKSDLKRTEDALSYWLKPAAERPRPIPLDFRPDIKRPRSVKSMRRLFDLAETQRLVLDPSRRFSINPIDLLISANAKGFADLCKSNTVLMYLAENGRTNLPKSPDVSNTVGCFAGFIPVLVTIDPTLSPMSLVDSIANQLASVPEAGFPYGIHRYLSDSAEERTSLAKPWSVPDPEIGYPLINYLGRRSVRIEGESQTDQPSLFQDSLGQVNSLSFFSEFGPWPWPLHLRFSLVDDRLLFNCVYRADLLQAATVEKAMGKIVNSLEWFGSEQSIKKAS